MADIEQIQIGTGGFTFDALAAGPADGELVLLLHGFPQTSHTWRHVLPAIADAGFRAVAPDQRGYSPGARPPEAADYATLLLLDDALGMATALGAERFHVIGHDWGGALAWQLAGLHADRLLSLTVLSTPHSKAFGQALSGELGGDQAERSAYMVSFMAPGVAETFLADDAAGLRFLFSESGMTDEDAAYYRHRVGDLPTLTAAFNWYQSVDFTLADQLAPITTPALYIWSDGDMALGREAAEASANFVEGPYRFVELSGVGHWIPEQAADQIIPVILDHLTGR